MQVTYRQLHEFIEVAAAWIGRNADVESKFAYALRKTKRLADTAYRPYQEGVEDLSVKYASEKDGNLSRDGGGYLYTKENRLALHRELRALFNSSVEFRPHLAREGSEPDLTGTEREVFEGFVLAAERQMELVDSLGE